MPVEGRPQCSAHSDLNLPFSTFYTLLAALSTHSFPEDIQPSTSIQPFCFLFLSFGLWGKKSSTGEECAFFLAISGGILGSYN